MAPVVDDSPQLFACKCLNVRLRIVPTESVPPEPPNDTAFSKIYVGEDGIQVAHPQLTLRVKSPGVTIPGTTKCSRFTTLTCLVCDLAAYRVHQVISVEVEAKDLPLLPTDDWTEQEIMKSPSGWIEVHKDCLDVDAIAQIESSKDYSRLFSLTLPPAPDINPTSPTAWISPDSTPSSNPAPTAPASYLNDLPPLFPPPPFTPSHSAFLHLVSLAEKESESLRAIANEELKRVVRAKASEVQIKEAELKVQVERLWLKFKRGLDKIQQVDRSHTSSLPVPWSSTARTSDHRSNGPKAPVTVRSFDPVSVTAPVAPTPPPPRPSALSASLANPNLHQAMADRNSRNSASASNSTERTVSTSSSSPTLVPTLTNGRETSSVLRFPRLIDDTINTAASYRYFLNIGEEMAKQRKERGQEADSDHDETVRMAEPLKPPTNTSNKESEAITVSNVAKAETTDKETSKQTKGKNKSRHVHFNVQPATKGTEEPLKKSNGVSKPDPGEMVFPLDDDIEGGEGQPLEGQILPLLEQPIIPPRARRKVAPAGSAPFPGLRPESLPAPSQMRSARPNNIDTYSNNIMLSLRRSPGPISKAANLDKEDTTDQETSEDTTDSSPRPTSESDSDLEDEPGADHHLRGWGIPQSLPINVVSSIRPREVLSLKSYQPKSNIAEHQQVASTAPTTSTVAQHDRMSASAIRRAMHAERDRSRSLDPGTLDFVVEEDEGDEEEQEDRPVAQSMESGERGRRHALRILQAGADIPEEGMWRSLAS